ncbi:MAG: phosphoribosyltransferase family protein [bacterium]
MDSREEKIREIANQSGAFLTNTHVVYASDKHGSAYVLKDALYVDPRVVADLCADMALHFYKNGIGVDYDVVVGPEKGGIILAQWVAYNSVYRHRHNDNVIKAVYAEKETEAIYKNEENHTIRICLMRDHGYMSTVDLKPGQVIYRDTGKFVFKRGYGDLVAGGKKVLVVEDVLTTGSSVKKVVEAVRAIGGEVVGVAALCNRGAVTAKDIGDVPELFSLMNISMESWDASECPLCAAGVPINTTVGKGQAFLDRQRK